CHHLAYEAVLYANRMGIPILIDIRDLWPDIFLDQLKRQSLIQLGRLFFAIDFHRLKNLLRRADSIIAVSHGYLNWGLTKAGRAANRWDRVFYLGYRTNEQESIRAKQQSVPDWLKIINKKLFVFIGTFGVSYELGLLLQVARKMQVAGRNDVHFIIAGTGDQEEVLHHEARGLLNVTFTGWIGKDTINILLANSYAGLVPCRSIEHTLPNKPFEYLSYGLPLISSLQGEMADLIDKYKFGLNYHAGNSDELYHAIENLLDDHDLRERMSSSALAFSQEHGNAERIYKEYASHIENLYYCFGRQSDPCNKHTKIMRNRYGSCQ
ncbi:MAG: glycosyltransferase family 4 protein, partial [candidate division Zixibacteria bacterium]|nr:glycosyltransferase family 4 protein [candidate division Zixibacteria bacterium]